MEMGWRRFRSCWFLTQNLRKNYSAKAAAHLRCPTPRCGPSNLPFAASTNLELVELSVCRTKLPLEIERARSALDSLRRSIKLASPRLTQMEWRHRKVPPYCLDIACANFASDVISLPDRQRHNSQRRIFGSARGELRPIRDEQVFDIMGLTPFVHHAVLWLSDMRLVPRLWVDGYGGVGKVRVAPTES